MRFGPTQENIISLMSLMHGVRADLDLSAFLDNELTQVCFGLHQIQLHFIDSSGKASASAFIEGSWELDNYRNGDRLQAQDAILFKLLGDKVRSAEVRPPDRVVFSFVSGATLALIDDSDRYESFQLQPAGIVV